MLTMKIITHLKEDTMKQILVILACLALLGEAGPVYAASCDAVQITPIKTKQQYSDYYGTTLTANPALLASPSGTYKWGITNPKPLDMAYFAAHVMSGNKKFEYFRAKIYIDGGLKAPMNFTFQKNDRNGEQLHTMIIKPGETIVVDFPLNGAQKLYIASEIRINHGGAQRIIVGEPEFYNCKK